MSRPVHFRSKDWPCWSSMLACIGFKLNCPNFSRATVTQVITWAFKNSNSFDMGASKVEMDCFSVPAPVT